MNKYERLSHQRKQLQKEGLAPEWMSTASYQLLTENNYLNTAETPYDMYSRIANRAAELTEFQIPAYLGFDSWYDAFFDTMWAGWLSPSTPVLTNMGNGRGHPIACSGTHIGDSIREFYQARTEIAQLTQRGYGTSWCLDAVRSRGSLISTGGTANGIMQPAKGVVDDMRDVSQGNARRGSVGQYLDVLHPDFDELADQILADDIGWNIGWNITDEYKNLFRTDVERADYIWKRLLRTKMTKGKGYWFFLDKVNRVRPQMYVDRGFYVRHSNLCLAGDTSIQIRVDGEYLLSTTLEDLPAYISKYDKKVEVLSYNTDTKVPEYKLITAYAMTNPSARVLRITDESGNSIKCTAEHKIWTENRGYVEAKDLVETDELNLSKSNNI